MKKTNAAPAKYTGKALAVQAPAAKLTIVGQMREANVAVSKALENMAALMSEDMPLPALTGAYFLMRKQWNPVLKRLDEAANKALKADVSERGAQTRSEGGGEVRSMDVDFSGAKFRCVTTQALSSKPDLKLLTAETGLPESAFTMQVVTQEFSQDKLDALVAAKKVSQEQIDKCRAVKSVSLNVEKL